MNDEPYYCPFAPMGVCLLYPVYGEDFCKDCESAQEYEDYVQRCKQTREQLGEGLEIATD